MEAKTTEWRPGPTVCRCCLTEGCYKDISTEYFWMGKREVYSEMLSETLDLNIAYSQSGGPNSNSRLICEPCISRLRDATDFKRQVLECERSFMQYLDPVGSGEIGVSIELEKDVKIERVKDEKTLLDDDDDEFVPPDFGDEDDDDLDDQPLTKLASKIPKKESVDVLDLLDNAKISEKRKSSSKSKSSPAKKSKLKKEVASSSKVKPEPRKKKDAIRPLSQARRNAEVMVQYTTAYPFRLPETSLMCVYCCESYADSTQFRQHMNEDHQTFKVETAFAHCNEGYLKADCTDLRCRICWETFKKLDDVAKHINDVHDHKILFEFHLGIQPFKFQNEKLLCGICDRNFPCLRQLSRHMSSHYQNYTCEECGKSYTTNSSLQQHMRFSHIPDERICRRCKKTFSSLQEKRDHVKSSSKCWAYQCSICAQRFMTWTLKEQHLTNIHGQAKKTHKCPECGKVFLSRNAYRNHFATLHAGVNFVCSWCGRKFSTRRHLEQHTVVHTGIKLFDCPVCAKSFPRKANLTQHMWIHSEYKRFECTSCNKQFNQRVSYKSHMKAHHPEIQTI